MKSSGLPAPTKGQKATWKQLQNDIGCAVCLFSLGIEGSEGEIHHILNGNRRISHSHVLALCAIHHRQGVEGHPSRHSVNGSHGGKYEFEQQYGTELHLLERSEAWIDRAYSEEAA